MIPGNVYVPSSGSTPQQQYTWEAYFRQNASRISYLGSPAKSIINANVTDKLFLMASPFLIAKTTTIYELTINVGLIGSFGSTMLCGIYSNTGVNDCYPGTLQDYSGENTVTFSLGSLGQQTVSLTTQLSLSPGLYWFVTIHNSLTIPQLHCIASPGTSANTMPGLLGWTNVDTPFNGWNINHNLFELPTTFDAAASNVSVYLPNVIATVY